MRENEVNNSVESQIKNLLKECVAFNYYGESLPVKEINTFRTFTFKEGNYKEGNILFEGLIEVYIEAPEGKCSKSYKMTGTADKNEDGVVHIVTPINLSASSY